MSPRALSSRLTAILATLFSASPLFAVPVAVNDAYTTNEDTTVNGGNATTQLASTGFEAVAAGSNILTGNWNYCQSIGNEFATVQGAYPVDEGANNWKAASFDVSTSVDPGTNAAAPWAASAMPIQGGGITALTGAAELLTRLNTGAGGTYQVTTYLFRKVFTATAAQAAIATWTARRVADDGCIVYLNGVEIDNLEMSAANYPRASLTTNTTVTTSSNEAYADATLTLPAGLMVAGTNVLAIEVHQTLGSPSHVSSDAGLDYQLSPGAAADPLAGFAYADDVYGGTTRPASAAGAVDGGVGNPGSSIRIDVSRGFGGGGGGGGGGANVSGGYRKTIAVPSAGTVRVVVDAKVRTTNGLEDNEFVEAFCLVDGNRYSPGTGSTPGTAALVRGTGPNPAATPSANGTTDTGWGTYSIDIPLTAGNHVFTFGGFGPRPSSENNNFFEAGAAYFDNLSITLLGEGVNLLNNDTGGATSVALATGPSHGQLTLNSNGSFAYTPELNYNGTDTFTYTASDGATSSAPATVTITITPVNDAPAGVVDGYNGAEDTQLVVAAPGVLENDTDVDAGTTLTAAIVAQPPAGQGTVVLSADGSFVWTPGPNFFGTTTFTYRASDGTATSAATTVTLNIAGAPDAPIGVADTYTLPQNAPFVVNSTVAGTVTEDIIPLGADGWHYFDSVILADRNLGTAWRNAAYVESADWKIGKAELGYGDADEVTILNDNTDTGPFVSNASDKFASYYFRRSFEVTNLANVTGVQVFMVYDDAGMLYLNGSEVARTSGIPTRATMPDVAWDYYTNAGGFQSVEQASTTFTLDKASLVEGTNLVAAQIQQQLASSSDLSFNLRLTLSRLGVAGVLANDSDPDKDNLTAALVSGVAHGSLVFNADGTFTYTPASGYKGADGFSYEITDGTTTVGPIAVTLDVVSGPNVAPVAVADTYAATEDTALVVAAADGVLKNDTDADGDPFTAVVQTQPAHGTLALAADGSFTYTPAGNYNGTDSFTYKATDGKLSNAATVTLNIAPANDAPVAVNDAYDGDPGSLMTVAPALGLLKNDSDIDAGTTLTARLVAGPATGSLTLAGDGGFTFSAPAGGTYTFTYEAFDGTAPSNVATVTVVLDGAPATLPESYSTSEDAPLVVAAADGVLKNDTDPEGKPLTASLVAQAAHGTVVLAANGGFTYAPASNYSGADSFAYRASDGVRLSAVTTVTLNVTPVNDAPAGVTDDYVVRLDVPLIQPAATGVLANDSDAEGDTMTVQLVATTTHGVLALSADGSFTYTPATGYLGPDSFTYRASDGLLLSATTTVNLFVSGSNDVVVISEIMYNPPGGDADEYIELLNTATYAVDLAGWKFDSGVGYTFPAGTTIAGGASLAVPASRAAFVARYPAAQVTSTGWGPTTGLSNGGERVRLIDDKLVKIDEVTYADEGDWATRRIVNVWDHSNTGGAVPPGVDTDPGLEWYTQASPDPYQANAGGHSIQLINKGLSNNYGQNWTNAVPTPGAANSAVTVANSAPLILDVKHFPPVPGPSQQVNITARLLDEAATGFSASIFYRTGPASSATASTAAFAPVAMSDDGLHNDGPAGDGVWGGTVPAQSAGTVVEFYVQSTDVAANTRTWPAPALDINGANPAQSANCLYQVDTAEWTDSRPLHRLVMTGNDNYRYDVARWSSSSNEALNTTLITRQGQNYQIRYRCSLSVRGNSSRSWNPRNWRFDIPGDDSLNGRTAFMFNSKYTYSQVLAARLQECVGLPGERGDAVAVHLNGVNHAIDANANGTYGYFADMQPYTSELTGNLFPFNGGGNLYSKIRGSVRWGTSTLPVMSTAGYATGGYVNEGWTKKSNTITNDWTDLHAWLQAMNSSTAANFDTVGGAVIDMDEWAKWWAFTAIVNHAETNPSNGDDDDYAIYFGPDRKGLLLAHDFDTCFNLQAIGLGDENAAADATIYQATANPFPTNDNATIPQMDKFYRNPVTGRKFKAELRRQLETIFAKPGFDVFVDSQLSWLNSSYSPTGDAIRTHIKSFMDTRRNTILGTHLPTVFTATTSLAVTSGYPRSTSATDLGSLGGAIDPARTAKVTVNGVTVTHSPYDNTWTAGSAITLLPGLNPLLCQAWDESNAVIASQTIVVWYEAAGATRSGTLAASETWTAAGGPWNVTSTLTIPTGVTLTIQPGATVFLGSGANITVSAGGRLVADGTEAAKITLDRAPAATAAWGGVVVNGGTGAPQHVVRNVIIANNGSTAVHAQNGADILIDRVTFRNTAVQYLSLDASSFIVSNCTFPPATAGFEPVHGTGGIAAGGRGIIRDCVFGKPVGYNDTVDFTGGNRPGPILHVLNCVFNGSDDDALDLDSTDAWVEGNVFLHIHRNGSSPDSSSGVSGGDDNGAKSEVTVIRNLFYDCDNAVTMKQGNSFALIQNTIAHITRTGGIDTGSGAINFGDDGTAVGSGALVEGNIIWDVESLTRNYNAATTLVTLRNNILPVAWTGPGSGNLVVDPLLGLAAITTPATATVEQIRAAFTLVPCSPARGTGPLGGGLGGLVPEGVRVALPRFSPSPLASLTLNAGPAVSVSLTGQPSWNAGYTHYRWSLDGGAVSADTAIATPLTLGPLADGNHTLSIEGRRDSGDWQSSPSTFTWVTLAAQPTVVLNEVLAGNTSAYALGATRPDVVELYNYGDAPLNLAGFTLSDDPALAAKYTFPSGTSIPAGGYLVVAADSLPSQAGELHCGFGLGTGGETVTLYRPGSVAPVAVDSVTFGLQVQDYSVGRDPATGVWGLNTPSIGLSNTPWCNGFGPVSGLKINEWLATNDIIVDSDFVELFNPSTLPVALGGAALTDDYTNYAAARAAADGSVYVIPPLSFIPAGGFSVFRASGSGPDVLTFNISRLHDSLSLVSLAGDRIDHVWVNANTEDRSEGRAVDGAVALAYFSIPTPGLSNGTNTSSENALLSGLRITEIMFDPPAGRAEFIEFKNISSSILAVTGVRFASGLTFTFPTLSINPGEFAVITNDLVKFNAQFAGRNPVQWAGGKLSNGSETLRIETPVYQLGILDFSYSGAWYPETHAGASLEIIDPLAAPSAWDQRDSWQPCVPSPGGPSVFGVLAPQDLTVQLPSTAVLEGFVCLASFASSSVTVQWSQDSGPAAAVFSAPANRKSDVTFPAGGTYVLRLTATGPGAVTASDTITIEALSNTESYATWAARTLSAYGATDQAADADPDGDGAKNLVEYATGSNPASPNQPVACTFENNRLGLRYKLAKNLDPKLRVIPQVSLYLDEWYEGSGELMETLESEDATSQTWLVQDLGIFGDSTFKYLRLKVVLLP